MAIQHIQASLHEAHAALESLLLNKGAPTSIERATGLLIATFERKGRVYSCGNGEQCAMQCTFPKSLLRQRWEIDGVVSDSALYGRLVSDEPPPELA